MRPNPLPPAPELRTARLTLRPWHPDEAPAVLQLIEQDRARLTRDFPKTTRAVQDEASARVFIEIWDADWLIGKGIQFGIWPQGAEAPVGFVSVRNIEWEVPKAELAYLLSRAAEGQGLMHEAATAVIDWAFRTLGLERVYCHADPENQRSAALAQRCGLRREGLLRNNFRGGDGLLHDSYSFGLTRADWLAGSTESA
ncbi:GNAT family N-acetyltransferase [Hymenobacter jeollabukensis]|uniref:GNAT family N-acetyltransferase n=1 Tax=Hymenobacter jeollabukensis TaxID=2025313 RepID=A0A5R8WMI3_9BACT|nr:GNAT family protein [Hymenobacter jeollabukensis]TLM90636.1 GNAT family N-acetyltransferase [Hymenobacter jeollabukensis]